MYALNFTVSIREGMMGEMLNPLIIEVCRVKGLPAAEHY